MSIKEIFACDGTLSANLKGFEPRKGQQQMAEAVSGALAAEQDDDNTHASVLLVEAETGIGKTLAYLVPALLSGRRVVISTATITLQDQILKKEIPPEDARFVLPNATTTNITITMNARELLHFFELRCCMRAQWEIRDLACMMLEKVTEVAPIIFENAGPPCNNCPEPDFPCKLRNNIKNKRRK